MENKFKKEDFKFLFDLAKSGIEVSKDGKRLMNLVKTGGEKDIVMIDEKLLSEYFEDGSLSYLKSILINDIKTSQ